MTFYPGMDHLMENTVLNVKNRSHTVTAEIEVSQGATDGVLIAQGGRFAGWSLYVKDGLLKYAYNWFDIGAHHDRCVRAAPDRRGCQRPLPLRLRRRPARVRWDRTASRRQPARR